MGLIKKKNNLNVFETIKEQNKTFVNNIELNDEFDREEISNVINSSSNLIIKADIAGAGKTSAFTYTVEKSTTLLITPYNALCFELRKKDFKALTLHKLIGLRCDGEEAVNSKCYDLTGIERIIFDEIYLYSIPNLEKIKQFMDRNSHIKFNATGDEFQLEPIQEKLNVDNFEEYYNSIIHSMFPNVITLHENKRCKTDEDRKIMKELTYKIRNAKKSKIINILKEYNIKIISEDKEITTTKNICALNRTCETVNQLMMKKLHPNTKYQVYQDLICRKSFKQKSKQVGYVNFTYTILDIDDEKNKYTLTDGESDDIVVTKEQIESYFKLPYARTCHSQQGLSIDEKITIFDLNHFMVGNKWIYTAITRTTDIKNIQFYIKKNRFENNEIDIYVEENGLEQVVTKLHRDIGNHWKTDRDAGRNMDDWDLTPAWALDILRKTKRCSLCMKDICEDFSIDRIDNSKGHLKDNCRIICWLCNVSKK